MADRFVGFSPAAVEFYARLAADNTKAFWTANRDTYEREIKRPMQLLADEIADEFGPLHIFRPHRDVRFSTDKSPYKDHQGAVTEGDGGEAYYLQISADGLMVAGGYYQFAPDQLARFREAIDDGRAVPSLEQAVNALVRKHFDIGGEALKTAPRGFSRDHPHVRWLRHKGLYAARTFGTPSWLSTRRCLDRITSTWRDMAPLFAWLNTHVGPSELPPTEL